MEPKSKIIRKIENLKFQRRVLKAQTLKKLLSGITKKNIHKEIDFGHTAKRKSFNE